MNFRSIRTRFFFILLFAIPLIALAQPGNNTIAGAVTITPVTSCGATTGQTLYQASSDVSNSSCGSGTRRDIWYKFTTPTYVSSVSITVSNRGSSLTNSNSFIEAYNADEDAEVIYANRINCGNTGTTLNLTNLSQNRVYYFRVFTTSNPTTTPSTNWEFSVCVSYTPTAAPANNECSGATSLGIGSTGTGTVWGATSSGSIPMGCASGTPDDDVWYKFTATAANVNVALPTIGTDLSTAGTMLQLFSGTCASLTSVACGYKSLSASGLNPTSTYYIRVYSSDAGSLSGISSGSDFTIAVTNHSTPTSSNIGGSRMNEVFQQTIVSPANGLNDPWEITYGADGYLWITEAKGYRVFRMDPVTGLKSTVLDISQNSTFLPVADRGFNQQFNISTNNPQGGLAGLALHPDWTTKKYVYISYVHTYSHAAANNAGVFFTNRIVRFTYNTTTNRLESPISVCATLPGSSDHNSQRMIIAPVGGTNYLFYAAGDMGSGQFGNCDRPIQAQTITAYEGKILRFNLEPDGDGSTVDQWIPNDNPYNTATKNAVWCIGIRNNQGFAYGNGKLYGSSHGPYSDDEINILESAKNYGHPLVIGKADGNYNNSRAGNDYNSTPTRMPLITNEVTAAANLTNYADPIFSAYAPSQSSVNGIYTNPVGNENWPSEAWSGLDHYNNTLIPGWKNSLVAAALKWGRLMRFKLNGSGSAITQIGGSDTIAYFDGQNRFRDIAFSPDGKDIFVVMDKSTASSGPTANNPAVITCAGCVFKYTFLGYADDGGKSTIPSAINITAGATDVVSIGTTVTINAANNNNNLWVPLTGPDGNILAEIKANGNNLGTVTSSFYVSGSAREDASKKLYLNRSITITPQTQPVTPVSIRLYLTNSELDDLKNATSTQNLPSGVTGIGNIKIRKNDDASPEALTAVTTTIDPVAEAHGADYVLQADISSFSTFYFGNPDMITLPLTLLEFKGSVKDNNTLLQWETAHERNTHYFVVERSIDGRSFESIGTEEADKSNERNSYSYLDKEAANQSSAVLYYRLKMVDMDGAYTSSKVISVTIDPVAAINIYPNPIEDVLNLRIVTTKAEQITIQVTDMQGRVLFTQARSVAAGSSDIKINTKAWPSQSYSINITGSNGKVLMSKKIVKM